MKATCPRISRCSSDSVSISFLSLQQKWPFSYQNGSRQKDTYSTFNKAFFGDVGTIMRASELWGSHHFVFSCCLLCDVERSCCVCSFVQFSGGGFDAAICYKTPPNASFVSPITSQTISITHIHSDESEYCGKAAPRGLHSLICLFLGHKRV